MATTQKPTPKKTAKQSSLRRINLPQSLKVTLLLFLIAWGVAGLFVLWNKSRANSPVYTGIASRQHSFTAITNTQREHDPHPKMKIVSAMATWELLQPTKDSYNWTQMNANVADAKAKNYKIIFRVMAGANSPSWLYSNGVQKVILRGADKSSQLYCQDISVPVPWDASLKTHYTNMMGEVGRWMNEPMAGGGYKRDYIYFVPVALPTWQGSEMTMGYGEAGTCPDGSDLPTYNRTAWNKLADEPTRRARVEQAWKDAIDIHMQKLQVPSAIAYGHLFNDGQAAAERIATEKVGQYPNRLFSMYTNLRPNISNGQIVGTYAEWCPRCDRIMKMAMSKSRLVGFQSAGTSFLNTSDKLKAAAEDGLKNYGMKFFEVAPDMIDTYEPYLMTSTGSLQDRMESAANPTSVTPPSSSPTPPPVSPPAGDGTPPSAPTDLKVTAAEFRAVSLAWSGSSDNVGVSGYYVYRNGENDPIAFVTDTYFRDAAARPNKTYSYQVSAVDAAYNESPQSNKVTASTKK